MKANEFQIGDWVQWNFDVEPKHRQIFSIITEEDSDGNKEYYADLGDGEIYKDLSPIPLTAEILEKNGIVRSGMFMCKWWNDKDVIYTDESFDNHIDVSICGNDNHSEYLNIRLPHKGIGIPLYYVHELQHALRLCGLSDLADNFKL